MPTTIKLHNTVVREFTTSEQAERWLEASVDSTGHIKVYIGSYWHPVLPSELVMHTDTPEPEAMHKLSSHPRCPTCGCTTFITLHSVSDHWVGMYTCGHHTMGYMHEGTKVEYCLYCKGSEETTTGDTCPYCKAIWS